MNGNSSRTILKSGCGTRQLRKLSNSNSTYLNPTLFQVDENPAHGAGKCYRNCASQDVCIYIHQLQFDLILQTCLLILFEADSEQHVNWAHLSSD